MKKIIADTFVWIIIVINIITFKIFSNLLYRSAKYIVKLKQ